MKRVMFKITTIFLSLVIALLIGEVLARMLRRGSTAARWHIKSERYGYVNKKNFSQMYIHVDTNVAWEARFNSYGHRGSEYNLTDKEAKRVLCLGDSYTLGHGLEEKDIFASKLQECLNQQERPFLVMNAGVCGWGTRQETLYARDHLQVFEPDVVIITFCDNDQIDDEGFVHGLSSGLIPSFIGKDFLREHSVLYRLLFYHLHDAVYAVRLRMKKGRLDPPDEQATPSPSPASQVELPSAGAWLRTKETIRQFHKDFLAFNPEGLVLVQATHPMRRDFREHLGEVSNHDNLLYVDLHDDFINMDPDDILLEYDPHWSAKTHAVSAQALCRAILQYAGKGPWLSRSGSNDDP